MKIHESMNVLLHKLKFYLLLPAFSLAAVIASGQSPTLEIHNLEMLKNTSLEFAFESYNVFQKPEKKRPTSAQPAYHYSTFSPGSKRFGIAGTPSQNKIIYTPPTGFIGRDTIEILRWIEGPGYTSKPAYLILHIKVVPSQITAMPDYMATNENQMIEIDVLSNDYGTGTNQKIAEVTNRNRGVAVLNTDSTKVLFTPTAGFTGLSHFNYSICDAQGACDMTTVNICVMNPNPPAYDSIYVQTKEGDDQVILMALDSNYSVLQTPANGVVIDTFDVLTYRPNAGFEGEDKVIFEDPTNNRIRVFQIEVIGPAPYESIFLKDDFAYTAIDETSDNIYLLKNDVGGNYLIGVSRIGNGTTAMGGSVVYVGGYGLGVYQYVPPAGFSGVDYFQYKATVPGGGLTDTATCYIIVDDFKPELPVYELVVPEETPLVLGDHLPFMDYEYEIVSNPTNGTLTYLPGQNTYTSAYGQVVSGHNMVIYEPNAGATGTDEFEVEYCVGAPNNCQLAKIELNIVTIANPQSDTLCAGSNCVWPGDTDNNGKVDINDVLPIGLCMGEVGQSRSGGSTDWYAQNAANWNSLYIRDLGYDVKNVDADGNGIISSMDTAAISQFYGKYNNIVPAPHAPISELPFYPDPFPGVIEPGDVIYIPLNLGNHEIPAIDAYGLTFSVEYDPALFESVKVIWTDDAWMNYNSPVLTMDHKPYLGKLDAAYTRTSGVAATGHGIIGVLEFIVIDDVAGLRPTDALSTVNISGNLMNSSGQNNSLNKNTLTFSLAMNDEEGTENEIAILSDLKVFPNPSQSTVNVHLNGEDNLMERIALYNMVGSQVYDSGAILAKRTRLDVSGLNPGVYVLRVWANGEMLTSKVEVLR